MSIEGLTLWPEKRKHLRVRPSIKHLKKRCVLDCLMITPSGLKKPKRRGMRRLKGKWEQDLITKLLGI